MYRHRAGGTPTSPEIRVGEEVNGPSSTTVRIEGRGAQPVRLKERLEPRSVQIQPISNDNQRFFVRVGLGKMRPGTPVYLGLEGRWWFGGLGTTLVDSEAIFEVDRAAAMAIAAACSIPAHERSPLDTSLRPTWRFPDQVVSGRPAEVTLQIVNEGTATLELTYCPYWLHVEATRDGSPVQTKARIYSGPTAFGRLAPGAPLILRADLRDVVVLDQPGRYAIGARFDGQLQRGNVGLMEAALSGAVWDVHWTGAGELLVG
jgi:hypothetical protein